MSEPKKDYPEIFLSPQCACDDRTWCSDEQGACEECGEFETRYVNADQLEAQADRIAKLEAALENARRYLREHTPVDAMQAIWAGQIADKLDAALGRTE